jgi:drug/metabolite transporter (DMT)-like permease
MSAVSVAFLVLSNFLGGASAPIGAWTLSTWHPAASAFWRTLFGALLLLPFLRSGLGRGKISREDWVRMALVGVFGFAAPMLIGSFGLAHSTAAHAALLTSVEPVCIVLLSAFLLREPLSLLKTGAILSGLFGSALIIQQGIPFLTHGEAPHWRGDALLFTQGFFWALYTIIGKPVLKKVEPMTFTAATTMFSLPILGAAALLEPGWRAGVFGGATAPLLVGAVMTLVGPWAWNVGMQAVPASTLANFIFLQPVVGVGIGVLFQGNRLTLWSGAGGALILLGVYAAARET